MKRLFAVIISLIFLFSLSFSAFAEQMRVIDNMGLLSAEERTDLEEYLSQMRENDEFDIVIVTEHYVDDYQSYADDYYDYNGYGYGDDKDGLLLLVTGEDCWLSTTGFGIVAIDPNLSQLGGAFHEDVDSVGYYEAFINFADGVSECLAEERSYIENGYDDGYYNDDDAVVPGDFDFDDFVYRPGESSSYVDYQQIALVSLIAGLIVAFIGTSIMKGKLKSVRKKYEANDCVKQGSMKINRSYDRYLYHTVTRTARPKETTEHVSSGSSHSGGSVHTGSSGTSHGGGRF